MPLRKRLSLASAIAVGIAVALAVTVCYLGVRTELLRQVDSELSSQEFTVLSVLDRILDSGGNYFRGGGPSAGGPAPYAQVVYADGTLLVRSGAFALPVDAGTLSVADGSTKQLLQSTTVDGAHLRILTFSATFTEEGAAVPVAVQLARPLGPVDNVLSKLRLILLLLLIGGVALAAVLGRFAAKRVLAPLAEVTRTAQVIGETDDLSRRLTVGSDDEVGQLASRFNEMLGRLEHSREALDDSVRAQRQLVADASHELRTPVTSLRTNVEVLLSGAALEDDDRERLLADVVEQSEELSELVSDLIELARGDLPPNSTEDVRLDRVVEDAVERARRNAPGVRFVEQLEPIIVEGAPERLGRAVNNLLDNAARHTDGPVEVTVDPSGVRVRDHGGGISDKDLAHVFDRFYRGENSRGRQGSGLGLAIVRQVATQHGGSVTADNAPDGGAVFTLCLPGVPAAAPGGLEGNDVRGDAGDTGATGGGAGGDPSERIGAAYSPGGLWS